MNADGGITVEDVIMVLVGILWAGLVVAVFSRVVVAIVLRQPRGLRDSIAKPVVDSVAVESALYGWPPTAEGVHETRD